MNCPKCGSPLSPGDKFCQVCGSAIEIPNMDVQPTPPVQQPFQVPNVQPQPVPTPVEVPSNVEEHKNNSTLIVVLVGIIAILVVAIVAILFLGNGKDNNSDNGNTEPTTVAKVEEPKYNEVSLDKYRFKLMSGYSVKNSLDGVVLSNTTYSSQALFSSMDGYNLSDVDAVALQVTFKETGYDATFKELTIEGKKSLLFTGKYNGFDYEVLYVQQEGIARILGTDILYKTPNDFSNDADNIHKMVALTTISESVNNESQAFGKLYTKLK